jgi:hypothetical protein
MNQTRDSAQFEAALKTVDRRYNTILFTGLGVMIVMSFLYENSDFKQPLADYAMVGVLLSFLGSVVVMLATEKNRIARSFGLNCQRCSHLPLAIMAVKAFRSGQCPNCGTEYQSDDAQQSVQTDRREDAAPG